MRIFLPVFTILFITSTCFDCEAQNNLSGSEQTSCRVYVYQITEKEAFTLFKTDMKEMSEVYLHSLVDSFPVYQDAEPNLKPGNYLFVSAKGSKLSVELRTIGPLTFTLLNNNLDLEIAFHTPGGEILSNVDASMHGKQIPFDPAIRAYRLQKRIKGGYVCAVYQGALYYFQVNGRRANTYYGQHSFLRSLRYSFPIRNIINPIERFFFPYRQNRYQFSSRTATENKFSAWMVFNKPIFKPGDSVQLKAFIMRRNGKAINRSLLVRLSNRNLVTDTIIGVVSPFRPGGYTFKFLLNDSLHILLDEHYTITLEELHSKKIDPEFYLGKLDNDEYAAKRKVLCRGQFKYEEYELKSTQFSARSDKPIHYRGEPLAIYLKATDENELPVLDGRVEILVHPASGIKQFHADSVFIPDTLWFHTATLETAGETKIILPDSIFPPASLDYEIKCTFLNSNNESREESLRQTFNHDSSKIDFRTVHDSLFISCKLFNAVVPAKADIVAFSAKNDTIQKIEIDLPATIPINPYASRYLVSNKSRKTWNTYSPVHTQGMLSCTALRTKDSVFIHSVNPNQLNFWYTIFAGNHILKQGYDHELNYHRPSITPKNYFILVQYVWASKLRKEEFTVPYQNKLLQLTVNEPAFVYPGQETHIDVDLKDASGNPVQNADLTAFAFTKKFEEARAPEVPYLGKIYSRRKSYTQFNSNNHVQRELRLPLNWNRWSREMGLDTIEYYRFLHPKTIYRNTEPAKEGITQIAPFVSEKGELINIHQLYIDERPVFFDQARQLSRYSFYVAPGKHSLRLRTGNKLISIDSIWASAAMKTFLCINADSNNKTIRISRMPDSLTVYERNLWVRYMILVQHNFGENFATISQDKNIFLLNPYGVRENSFQTDILTGPFAEQPAFLQVKKEFNQHFDPEGGNRFAISPGLIKEKEMPQRSLFNTWFTEGEKFPDFHDYVLTEKEVDSLWQDYLDERSATMDLFKNEQRTAYENGALMVNFGDSLLSQNIFIRNTFLFRYDNPDFLQVYKGIDRKLGYLEPGMYRILFLLKGDKYMIRDSIRILKNGINYYRIDGIVIHVRDSVSRHISDIVNSQDKRWIGAYNESDRLTIKESFNERYLDRSRFSNMVFGKVTDQSGAPIVGCAVMVKGTKYGTTTDYAGNFHLLLPEKGVLVFAEVGFESREQRIGENTFYDVKLTPSNNALSEVIVTGYSISRKRSLTSSISIVNAENMLAGSVAGIQIRGITSIGQGKPLIIIDGLPYSGDVNKLDSSMIQHIQVLQPGEAAGIYGLTGANGVILITTKANLDNNQVQQNDAGTVQRNSIRRHFRDDAFWQPQLHTDENGKVSFPVKFPDDITSWRSFYIAMGPGKQTGYTEGRIKSFKSLSANLSLPSFFVSGDSSHVMGKILNYAPDSVVVERSIFQNDSLKQRNNLILTTSHLDTILLHPAQSDSLKLKYLIQTTHGYSDGEERTVPIYPAGVKETLGSFLALDKDSTFSLSFDTARGPITIYAESSLMPVLLDEIEHVKEYEYLCNEQLASKLTVLLLKKKIYSFLKKDFAEEKNIRELISKLSMARSPSGLWGWWNNTTPQLWISMHAIEALLEAEKSGYSVSLNKQQLTDQLVYAMESYRGADKLNCLRILQLLHAKVDFRRYIDSVNRQEVAASLYDRLKFLSVKMEAGMDISLDSIIPKHRRTMFGNWYWGEENQQFFDNSIQNTVLMYRLLRDKGGNEDVLRKIRNYFLEKRKSGNWSNTYESCLILETILPDLLIKDSSSKPVSLAIDGSNPVSRFPYKTVLNSSGSLDIRKQGTMPVYFTAYQQFWNATPKKVSGDFTVTSGFQRNGRTIEILKAGEAVELNVDVYAEGDADYVMVEIPVPAGCSYRDKFPLHQNNEVHREYFKNKVSIFCSSLTKGNYRFTVSLMPRFTGTYHLNPAKAEMMYFPVFYGREGMKKVGIE